MSRKTSAENLLSLRADQAQLNVQFDSRVNRQNWQFNFHAVRRVRANRADGSIVADGVRVDLERNVDAAQNAGDLDTGRAEVLDWSASDGNNMSEFVLKKLWNEASFSLQMSSD